MIIQDRGSETAAVANFKGRLFTAEVILWAVRCYLMLDGTAPPRSKSKLG
ncbi:protein of unknown function [Rhodovastum atsumiense]|nr:protein of unknown function [Rhodovastum atsumiense]